MACGGSSSASPSPIPRTVGLSFAGAWQGTVNAAGPGATLQLDISQFGENLRGAWTLSVPAANGGDSGSMTGRIVGAAMSLVLQSGTSCPIQVSGTLESDTRMSGTFSTFSAVCASGLSTPIVLERRGKFVRAPALAPCKGRLSATVGQEVGAYRRVSLRRPCPVVTRSVVRGSDQRGSHDARE